jgi:hypothetical protein
VIRRPREPLEEAAALLPRCLVANPNFVDHFSEERARSHALPPMFAADLGDALGFGHVYAVRRGVERSAGDELAGAIRGLVINAPVTQRGAGTHKLLLMGD